MLKSILLLVTWSVSSADLFSEDCCENGPAVIPEDLLYGLEHSK